METYKHADRTTGDMFLWNNPIILIFWMARNRDNADQEMDDLQQAYRQYIVQLSVFCDMSRDQILNKIDEVTGADPNTFSGLIVNIMSHGNNGVIRCGEGSQIRTQEIIDRMCSKVEVDKPKILIIQACRGTLPVDPHQDIQSLPQVAVHHAPGNCINTEDPRAQNVLILFATLNGFMAERGLYLKELAKALEPDSFGQSKDFGEIARIVQREMRKHSAWQVPETRSTMTKQCCLSKKQPSKSSGFLEIKHY